jgi:endonuclease-3
MVKPAAATDSELRDKALAIVERLAATYGRPTWRQHYDPVSELVLVFLSQNTSDLNSHRAYARLRERYPTWEEAATAPTAELADAIRSGGLADIKAPRIQEALRRILAERGHLSLDFLADLPLEEAKSWLTSLKGVGHKSAAIVLLFSFGRPAFPVDTHVQRVSVRLGVTPSETNREQTQAQWEALVPPEAYYALHLNLITHGRRVCRPARPLCDQCTLSAQCEWRQRGGSGPNSSALR